MYSNFKYETLVLIRRGHPVGGWQVRCCHRKKVDTGQARAVINARNDAINVQLKIFWREKIWVGFRMKMLSFYFRNSPTTTKLQQLTSALCAINLRID